VFYYLNDLTIVQPICLSDRKIIRRFPDQTLLENCPLIQGCKALRASHTPRHIQAHFSSGSFLMGLR
jgi:hypothetical protein